MQLSQPSLQLIHIIQLISFRRTHILMHGHVLHLSQVVVLQPVGDHFARVSLMSFWCNSRTED